MLRTNKLDRICAACDSTTTKMEKGKWPHWYKWDDVFLCHKCYDKYVWSPIASPAKNKKWNPIHNPIYQPRRICFKDKRIMLKENPRKGICQWCGRKGATDIHHIEYHEDDPLKDAIELCDSCHRVETTRLEQLVKTELNIIGLHISQ